jgi:hypothetical protein
VHRTHLSEVGVYDQPVRESVIADRARPSTEAAAHVDCEGVEETEHEDRMECSGQGRQAPRLPCRSHPQDRPGCNRADAEDEAEQR